MPVRIYFGPGWQATGLKDLKVYETCSRKGAERRVFFVGRPMGIGEPLAGSWDIPASLNQQSAVQKSAVQMKQGKSTSFRLKDETTSRMEDLSKQWDCSLTEVIERSVMLAHSIETGGTPVIMEEAKADVAPKKSRRKKLIEEIEKSDPLAKLMDRTDIDRASLELPTCPPSVVPRKPVQPDIAVPKQVMDWRALRAAAGPIPKGAR